MKRRIRLTSILATFVVLLMILTIIPTVASDGGETSTRQLADILIVRDGTVSGANGETIYPILIALSAAGYSYKYVPNEDALPPKWDDPRLYPSIFWICGDEPRGGIMTLLWGEKPTLRNSGKLAEYVRDGGNVLTTGSQIGFWGSKSSYTGTDYDDWVLHGFPGSGSLLQFTYTTNVLPLPHDIFTTPNLMPTTFSYSYFDPIIGSLTPFPGYGYVPFARTESTMINNGELVSEGVLKYYPGLDTVVYDGLKHGSYGRTVYVNRRVCYQWDSTDKGDMLTPFIQNVAAWFNPPLTAKVSVEPESLKLSSNGQTVNVKIQEFRGKPIEVNQVDPSSVKLNGIQCQDPTNYYFKSDGNFIIKADRLALEDYVNSAYGGSECGIFNLEVTGKTNEGLAFSGACTIKVMP